jgi:Gas vesicle synthesis protein GvpL/GvpF
MTRDSIGRATYLYCLLHRPTVPPLARAPAGLPGLGAPRALAVGPRLWLVVADAPLDRYSGSAIDRRLHDLDWVSACAMAHEAVVEHAATLGTAVPMKLFTLFTTEARALSHVRRRRHALAGVIRRIAGRQEWGVRIRATAGPASASVRGHPTRALSGTQFLIRKRREADARRRRATPAAAPVRRALGALGRISDGARRRAIPPAASRVSGLVADAVFLVEARERPRFLEAVGRVTRSLTTQGFDLTLTGPWPPYHFIPGRR